MRGRAEHGRISWRTAVVLAFLLSVLLTIVPAVAKAQALEDPRRVALDEFQAVPPFVVRVDVDHPDRVYHGGEAIQVSVRSEQSGYLYLFYCDANQQVSCLLPNQARQDNRITADQTVIIPDRSAAFQLRVGPPYGKEVLKAVVTTQPLHTLELQALTKGDLTGIGVRKFKGVFVELREQSAGGGTSQPVAGAPRAWSEHDVELTTVAPQSAPPARPGLAEVAGLPEETRPAVGTTSDPVVTEGTDVTGAAAGQAAARVGVFIGISKYRDPRIRPLTTAARDARAMAEAMRERGRLAETVLLVDEQATLDNIRRLIQEGLPAATRPGDLIILYWSGHGGRTANVDGHEPDGFDEYLVPYDGSLEPAEAIRQTMLLDKTFGRWVQDLDGRKLVVILDACHSGGQTQGARKALAGASDTPFRDFFFQPALRRIKDIGQRETAVLASSRATQLSFEQRGGNLSVMTHFLVERIRQGGEPLTLQEAAQQILRDVPRFVEEQYPGTTQTPVFVDHTTPPVYLRP